MISVAFGFAVVKVSAHFSTTSHRDSEVAPIVTVANHASNTVSAMRVSLVSKAI